ncbi:MAG: hypothetical protein ACLFVJ_04755 [Persicimonas sp.]
MVKIEGNNSQKVDRRDEHDAKKSEDKKDAKDFKKLLEKKGEKDKKAGEKTPKKTGGDKQTNAGSSKKSPGQKSAQKSDQRRRSGEFGERLRDGRQQLGEQGARRERVDTERQTKRQYTEKSLDGKKNERHWRDVDKGHAKKQAQRTPPLSGQAGQKSAKGPLAGAGSQKSDQQNVHAAQAQADKLAGLAGDPGAARGAGKADGAAPTQRSEMREQVAQLAQKLVEKAHVGQDAAGRRIMLLDLQVPGRGNVRVRLRRRGDGFELRMRPENQELARDLRREREHFRESAAHSGVEFSSIEIV